MSNPIHDVIAFHNAVQSYERYDWDHLLHPEHAAADADDIRALLTDFKAVDDLYVQDVDSLDLSLRLKATMIRQPILDRITAMGEASQRGETPPLLFSEVEAFMALVRYPNDLRDIAREQVRRYEEVLGWPFDTETS